ncbi:MAG: hypothetical protein CSA34_00640 [Desulfobulbus propionicus]|nr:MAG: hypothetical protein CSA34_00640 [Desulfobulbus propionicus]
MMSLVFILIGTVLVILQTTLFMLDPVWLLAPDLYYILVAFVAYRFDLLRGLIVLFPLAGLLDVLCGSVLGMYAIICFGGFFSLRLLARYLPVREGFYQIPMIGVSYLALYWLVYLPLSLFGPEQMIPWSWPRMLVRMGLVVLFAAPLFRGMILIEQKLQSKPSPLARLRARSGNRFTR